MRRDALVSFVDEDEQADRDDDADDQPPKKPAHDALSPCYGSVRRARWWQNLPKWQRQRKAHAPS